MKSLALLLVTLCYYPAFIEAQLSSEPVFELKSPDFVQGGPIPKRFTCDGPGHAPGLRIDGAPLTTKSLVLIMDDPDAPTGTFTHWLLWNLPADLKEIVSGAPPRDAIEGKNGAGRVGYIPPCPPSGEHRYYFRLYALDVMLRLPSGSTRETLERAMKGHVQKEALLLGRYAREVKVLR